MTTKITQKITPFLWFDGKAEEAARFYTSIFKDSEIESVSPMSATFRLEEIEFIALNGGPQHKFTEAISFFVTCKTQEEIDYFWEKLSAVGKHNVAAGSKISLESHGKLFLQYWGRC